jgi:hypothetical protein
MASVIIGDLLQETSANVIASTDELRKDMLLDRLEVLEIAFSLACDGDLIDEDPNS